jgi:translation elongation factor EF-1beta
MGKTLIVFKIKCIDMEGLDATIEAVKKIQNGEVKDVKKVPIGFGISEIKAAVLIPEKQDHVLSEVEEELRNIPNIEEIEVEAMTLL